MIRVIGVSMNDLISLDEYISKARKSKTHPAKLMVLYDLLMNVFGVKLEELIPGIEKKLGSRILGIRGRADLIFTNIIFEIKVDLNREIDDAKQELRKYFQAVYEKEPERKYIGIATDVINFKAYLPIIKNKLVIDIKEIGSINLSAVSTKEAIYWLDSFLFSKPKIRPTAEDLKWRFGVESPTYAIVTYELRALWSEVENESDTRLKLNLWIKNMEIIYGSKPEIDSFIDHTYLIMLVKLIVYFRLSGDNLIKEDKIKRALTGQYFTSYGISNLIEEDFFTWILHPRIANKSLKLACDLARELLRYDLSQIDEDFFKEIYQEIIERGQRHRIGEYYTPEWLAELILKEIIDLWWKRHVKPPRVLDPACGSGTFLYNTIHILKKKLFDAGWKQNKILDFILANIVGVDINPLAVTIAKANYLMALGDLLYLGKAITIPIYVADSMKIPRTTKVLLEDIEVYEYHFNNFSLQIPISIAKSREKLGKIIDSFKDAIDFYRVKRSRKTVHEILERKLSKVVIAEELRILKSTLDSILTLIDKGLDSIWIFILSNIYVPVALKESKFDLVVGNPPWIAMRYIENKEYQDFVKSQILMYELLNSNQIELFTHMEMATLFFCRTSDLYMENKGIIAFVMPRSVLTGAFQHANFKEFRKPRMKLLKIFDLENVSPLFNVPSCVLIATKGEKTLYPVQARKYVGKLPEKNIKLSEAIKHLKVSNYEYKPPKISTKYSWYHDKVRQGATIVPRNLWFIDFDVHPILGINANTPSVKTAEDIQKVAKKPWKSVKLKGRVESDFIYVTLLGGDIVPFGYTKLRPIVLPIEATITRYRLLDIQVLRSRGFVNMADWLEKAQKIWEINATQRSHSEYPRVIHWIDYRRKLTAQNPSTRFIVLYNTSGTNIVSCVVDRCNLPDFHVLKVKIRPKNFLAESTSYFYESNEKDEVHYICAILNSSIINQLIKPYQPKGLFGERHIHRRPFMLPIPKFDSNNLLHLRLAKLSKICHSKVASIKFTKRSTAGMRDEARKVVKNELREIDELVLKLLDMGGD